MKNFRLNPDSDYVLKIMEGIQKKQGHCPCQVEISEKTLCPCDKFINERKCCCNLYVENDK